MRRRGVVMLLSNADSVIGGTERQARLLAAELDARGIPVVIVTQASRRDAGSDTPAGPRPNVRIVRLPTMRRWPAWSLLASFLVWGAIHRREFDVIHAHNTSLGVIASIAGRLLRRPVIAKVTGMAHVVALAQPAPHRRLRRWVLTSHARLIALSAHMQAALSEAGVRPDAVELVPNGVAQIPEASDDGRDALRAAWLGHRAGSVALFVGRLTEGKRVDQLLRVWAAMPRPGDAVLVVVGDGPLDTRLAATAERLGLGASVRFLGLQSDVTPFYLMADVFVLPSESEGMSNALLEAMAAGLPVVASDIGGNREVVQPGYNGFLVDWTDVGGTAALLATLLSDRALRDKVGRAARERAAAFSISRVAERYARLYRALAAPKAVA